MLSTLRRAAIVAALALPALLALVLGASSASAHVTANSPGATQGGYAVITFRVPSESSSATTTAVTVQVPADTPLASARVKPVPGWTAAITMQTLPTPVTIAGREITQAVDTITWTANDGVGLRGTEFQEFSISAGPLPEVDEMVFKALQSYSDGSRVDWIEQAAPGSDAEPDHPAPTLALAEGSGDSDDHHGGGATATVEAEGHGAGDNGASGVAVAGLIVAIVALLAAGAALVTGLRRRGA